MLFNLEHRTTNELVTGEERERARRGRRRASSWINIKEPLQQVDGVSIPGEPLAGHAPQDRAQDPQPTGRGTACSNVS